MRSHKVPAEERGIAQATQRCLGADASPSGQGEARSARASGGRAGSEGASKTSDPAGNKEPHLGELRGRGALRVQLARRRVQGEGHVAGDGAGSSLTLRRACRRRSTLRTSRPGISLRQLLWRDYSAEEGRPTPP